jgi:hypothetical protein
MARFSQYDNYLPGEIYSSGLESIQEDPQRVVDYLTDKKFKFKPVSTGDFKPVSVDDIGEAFPGASFQRFLNLQNDPDSLVRNKMQTPQQFQLFKQLSNLGT